MKAAGKKSWRPRAQANGDSPPPPHFTVSVPLRCPQETVLQTLPPRVLQGAAVSGEHISQGPPGNVVALGCPPPPRRVSERSVQMLPVGSPFQNIVLNTHEAGTSSRNLIAWKHLSTYHVGSYRLYKKGINTVRVSPAQVYGGVFHRGGTQQVLEMEQ